MQGFLSRHAVDSTVSCEASQAFRPGQSHIIVLIKMKRCSHPFRWTKQANEATGTCTLCCRIARELPFQCLGKRATIEHQRILHTLKRSYYICWNQPTQELSRSEQIHEPRQVHQPRFLTKWFFFIIYNNILYYGTTVLHAYTISQNGLCHYHCRWNRESYQGHDLMCTYIDCMRTH